MSKYDPLSNFLARQKAEKLTVTFVQIEELLGFELPYSSQYPAWWSNNESNHTQTRAWRSAGYKTEAVDLKSGKLVFRREVEADKRLPAANNRTEPKPSLIGCLKGLMKIADGVDLTQPADPDWGKRS